MQMALSACNDAPVRMWHIWAKDIPAVQRIITLATFPIRHITNPSRHLQIRTIANPSRRPRNLTEGNLLLIQSMAQSRTLEPSYIATSLLLQMLCKHSTTMTPALCESHRYARACVRVIGISQICAFLRTCHWHLTDTRVLAYVSLASHRYARACVRVIGISQRHACLCTCHWHLTDTRVLVYVSLALAGLQCCPIKHLGTCILLRGS
jgi:hypothetical protein